MLSENWYPAWRARVDGTSVPIHRADVSLQGVVVPAGSHTVTFELESPAYETGKATSAAALLALPFIWTWPALRRTRLITTYR